MLEQNTTSKTLLTDECIPGRNLHVVTKLHVLQARKALSIRELRIIEQYAFDLAEAGAHEESLNRDGLGDLSNRPRSAHKIQNRRGARHASPSQV